MISWWEYSMSFRFDIFSINMMKKMTFLWIRFYMRNLWLFRSNQFNIKDVNNLISSTKMNSIFSRNRTKKLIENLFFSNQGNKFVYSNQINLFFFLSFVLTYAVGNAWLILDLRSLIRSWTTCHYSKYFLIDRLFVCFFRTNYRSF